MSIATTEKERECKRNTAPLIEYSHVPASRFYTLKHHFPCNDEAAIGHGTFVLISVMDTEQISEKGVSPRLVCSYRTTHDKSEYAHEAERSCNFTMSVCKISTRRPRYSAGSFVSCYPSELLTMISFQSTTALNYCTSLRHISSASRFWSTMGPFEPNTISPTQCYTQRHTA